MDKKLERWDIYDRERNFTGRTMLRNDFHMQPGDYHLTVLGVVHRPDDRFLITRRVLSKSWAPGHWEISGGGAQAGETSKVAVLRELFEETGIDASGAVISRMESYMRENPEEQNNYFVDIFRFEIDVPDDAVVLQTEEAMEYRFATRDEIKLLGEAGVFLHYNSIKRIFDL